MLPAKRRDLGRAASATGTAFSWGVLGEVLGNVLPLLFPGLPVAGGQLGALLGATFFGLAGIGLLTRWRRNPVRPLERELREADRLFITGAIDEVEYLALR